MIVEITTQSKSWITINVWCECKNTKKDCECEKNDILNFGICACESGKYSGSIVSDLVIMCDDNIKVTKTVLTKTVAAKTTSTKCTAINFNEKKVTYKIKKSIFYHLFVNYHITIDNR